MERGPFERWIEQPGERQRVECLLADNQRELAFRVVGVYGQWLSASLQRQALQASESLHQELLDRVQRRFDGGASTGSDLELAKGRLQSVKALSAATAAAEVSAVTTLSVLTGEELDSTTLAAAPRRVRMDWPKATKACSLARWRIRQASSERTRT